MAFQFKFPDIGEGIHEGKVLEVYVKMGDSVKEGDPLLKVETDKVITDIPSPKTGTIVKINCQPEQTIHVNAVIFEIDTGSSASGQHPVQGTPFEFPAQTSQIPPNKGSDQGVGSPGVIDEDGASVVGQIQVEKKGAEVMSLPKEHLARAAVQFEQTQSRGKVLATPVARKIARDRGLDIRKIAGSGPQGRVTRSDIERVAEGAPLGRLESAFKVPKTDASVLKTRKEPFSTIRHTISEHMTRALKVPHFAVHEEIEVSELVTLREKILAQTEKKLSFVAFFIKASALALKEFPIFNASIDVEAREVIYHGEINVGFAADTDRGLMVPVIKNADLLSLGQINEQLGELSQKARNQTIQLSEIRGGTFTVTSIGSIAGTLVHPVINVPEVAILGVGRIRKAPVVSEQGTLVAGNMLDVSLCADHRLIDGAKASRFLKKVCQYLGHPYLMWVDS
jgi:pyruvate dehydrogenase E2 component (dihydrolipoamide acetyltransferase)